MKALELMQTAGFSVDAIIHIGANDGQERYDYAASGASPCIYVEPIDSVFAALKSHIAEFPGHIAVQAVCADREGQTVTFNISSNSGLSSSFLALGAHAAFHPDIVYTAEQTMTTTTVDRLIGELELRVIPNLLVIDTQGTELKVLLGAKEALRAVDGVFVEASEEPLYEGGCTHDEITLFLKAFDLKLRWIELNGNGHGDAFYCRPSKIFRSASPATSSTAGLVNVALGKSASQSSYSQWSHQDEATDAISGEFPDDFAFHTDFEENPWWQVDLGLVYPIEAIFIHNRINSLQERARTLKVEISDDAEQWATIHSSFQKFGSARTGNPLELWPGSKVQARYLRLSLTKPEYLHLAQVEVFVRDDINAFSVFCERHGLPRYFDTKINTVTKYYLAYSERAVRPDIVGIKIDYDGRFGNQLIQVINAIHLAERTGLKYIQLSRHELLDLRETITVGPITFLPAHAPLPVDGAFIAGEFFNSDDFAPLLMPFLQFGRQDEIEFTSTVQRYIRPHLLTGIPLPSETHPNDELTIHLRAGDIFNSDHPVTYGYRQPPLSFYILVVTRMREAGRITKVRLIFEDRGNPCIGALEDWLSGQSIPYRITSGTLQEDMSALIDAPHLVFGHGTFGYAACRLSKQIETVHFFAPELGGSYGYMPNVGEVIKVSDRSGNYIKAYEYGVPLGHEEGWRNTPVMRELMLAYPIHWLEVETLPSSLALPQ